MCGRFTLTASPEEVADLLGLDGMEDFPPRYNIAPTQPILNVVTGPHGQRAALLVRWGLVPAWVRDPAGFSVLINARSESAATKPAFRNAMRHRRTLVPASGFYEWHRPADRKMQKQAYFIRPRDGGIVTFGGLMETWYSADGSEFDSGAILTTAASPAIARIHDRMPVVIRPEDHERWLDCKRYEPRHVADLMAAVDDDYFEAVPVSDKVNKVANTGPEVQEPSGEPPDARQNAGVARRSAGSGQYELF